MAPGAWMRCMSRQLRRSLCGPPSPWATAAAAPHRRSQPSAPVGAQVRMLPEARKLLARAQALLGDGHLRREDFEVAEHSALTLTTICADGEVNVDDEKLETLRKIVYSGMERKMKDANAMQQGDDSVLEDLAERPDADGKLRQNPSPPSGCVIC